MTTTKITLHYRTFDGTDATRTFNGWDEANRWIPTEDVHYVTGHNETTATTRTDTEGGVR